MRLYLTILPLVVFVKLVVLVFYVPSTHFMSFQARSVNLVTLFLGKKVNRKVQSKVKDIEKEQGKTIHEAPRTVNYRATQNKNNIGTTALERSVVYTTGGFKGIKWH